jgi:hypothetical protein
MYDSGILSEDNLVRESFVERISRTLSIARGSVMRYHVRVHDVVIKDAVVTRCSVEPERGHFETWEKAQAYLKQQIARYEQEGFAYEPVTKQLLRMWTLYNDSPQRHYRQIAARSENNAFFVMVFEGTVLSVDPFEKAPFSRERFDCGNAEQALKKAQELYESSIANGWTEYHPVYD